MSRVSLSFLVDTMDKRRGGCAPNIAYTLALLGETPRSDGDGRAGLRRLPPLARGGGRRHVAGAARCADKFTASFFCSTDVDGNQIASFYTGAMANAAELSFRTVADCDLAIISPNDPAAMIQYAEECRALQIPVHLGSGSAVRPHVRRRAAPGHRWGPPWSSATTTSWSCIRQKTGFGRGRASSSMPEGSSSREGSKGCSIFVGGRPVRMCRPSRPCGSSIRPASAMRSAAGS